MHLKHARGAREVESSAIIMTYAWYAGDQAVYWSHSRRGRALNVKGLARSWLGSILTGVKFVVDQAGHTRSRAGEATGNPTRPAFQASRTSLPLSLPPG
jgi:hypothetical protein